MKTQNVYYSSRDVAAAAYTLRHNLIIAAYRADFATTRLSSNCHTSVQILGAGHVWNSCIMRRKINKHYIDETEGKSQTNRKQFTHVLYIKILYTAVSCYIAQDKCNRKSSLVALRAFTAASDWQTGLLRLLCC